MVLSLDIYLWMMAGTKEAFSSHVGPKGLPKCTHELRILIMYHQQRHATVLDDQIEKVVDHLPHTKLAAIQETRGELTDLS